MGSAQFASAGAGMGGLDAHWVQESVAGFVLDVVEKMVKLAAVQVETVPDFSYCRFI